MREPDPQQDWLTSGANHASADYDRDRRGETWSETHDPSPRTRRQEARRRRQRMRNREARRFGKINWEAYSHRQLYDMIMRAEPATMYGRATQWNDLAGRIEGTTGRVQQIVERVMTAWQGQAAVNAAAANTRLMQWASTASHTAGRIAEGLANYTEAVESAQRRMPDPAFATAERNFRNGYTVAMTGGPSDAVFLRELLTDGMVSGEQARARRAEAVAVMESYESNSRQVHDTMPQFTDAQTGIEPGEAWTPGSTGGEAGGGDGGPPVGVGPGPSGASGSSSGTQVDAVPGGSTTAAGFADPSLTGGSGPGGQGGSGYGGGPGSLNGAIGGAQGGADAVRGGPGAGVGAGALAGRGMPGAAGAFAGPGGRGAPGAFGGMPFGAGANGEEDGEHTNKYDEGLDLFDDLPPAYPPVFGA